MSYVILQGDCKESLKDLPDNSVDSVVTDPPYGLKFMGKKWDYEVSSIEIWREVLRVLKPGGHVLSFCGTRTYHRMVVNMEDAGFEIRDQIQWIYGSGFPKSHNGDHGGTALKPANEPICLARKPIEGTVANNFEKWGVGGLNIDASRIGTEGATKKINTDLCTDSLGKYGDGLNGGTVLALDGVGRWPANVLFDEEAAAVLDEQTQHLHGASRFFYVAKASKSERNAGLEGMPTKEWKDQGFRNNETTHLSPRAGAGRTGANQNHHPTVKPIKLMQYLIKLITPPGGIVLDPFMGSGSTGVACLNDDYSFVGCEMSEEYIAIADKRLSNAEKEHVKTA